MSHELTILFQHHATDAVTLRRYERLKQLNPNVPIVPLTHKSGDVLPGTFDSAKIAGLENEHFWSNADLATYYWFRLARTPESTAKRYIFVEFDMAFRVPMREFYREVWDADIAGAQLFLAGPHYHWSWFPGCLPRLSTSLRPFAAGLVPLSGIMLAHRTLESITAGEIPRGIFSECRIATLARSYGYDAVELPFDKKRNITWRPAFVEIERYTEAYHPVKELLEWEKTPHVTRL